MAHIEVSATVLRAAELCHGGQWTALYSILSLGYCRSRDVAYDASQEVLKVIRDTEDDAELAEAHYELECLAEGKEVI